jgi:malonyl-CoA decarboxylase
VALKLIEWFGHRLERDRADGRNAPATVRKVVSLCRSLISTRGEASGGRIAGEIIRAYASMGSDERSSFFELMLTEFSPDPVAVSRAAEAYRTDQSPENFALLQRVAEPPRQELFRRLNLAPNGTSGLVKMRGQLLLELERSPQWAPIAADLGHLLSSWFNRGFLVLERIDWNTPAIILEKLIEYEAVHQIQGWPDLRRRLEADRRCFGFFHPALPQEPLVFIEAALTQGLAANIQPLLDPALPVLNPKHADCVIFYSITNCHKGLAGIPFGNFLIKQVVQRLGEELPRIKTFATLSPIPGFCRWLNDNCKIAPSRAQQAQLQHLRKLATHPEQLAAHSAKNEIKDQLLALCAYYLKYAKKGLEPIDPVARFHLRNGARIEQINWLGDPSTNGMAQSLGIMVNYVYRELETERNHERYVKDHRVLASKSIELSAKQAATWLE